MSLATHIETLQQKHFLLERMIMQESSRPAPDFMKINHLKKQKLVIKQEVFELTREIPVDAAAS